MVKLRVHVHHVGLRGRLGVASDALSAVAPGLTVSIAKKSSNETSKLCPNGMGVAMRFDSWYEYTWRSKCGVLALGWSYA